MGRIHDSFPKQILYCKAFDFLKKKGQYNNQELQSQNKCTTESGFYNHSCLKVQAGN